MNIIPSRPIKTQQFNKKTATGLVADAVLGHITLTIQLTNEDMTHQYIDQSFLIMRDTFTLDQPLLGRDFLKTNDIKLGFHPSFSIIVNGHTLKTDSVQSVHPKTTPMHYSSVSPSANESLAPGEISQSASVSNYSHFPSSNADLARYHLLRSASISDASQNDE